MVYNSLAMTKVHSGLLDLGTPLVFRDGSDVYREFAQRYITHTKGFFILAPSGSGKTYFINRQTEPHWIDGDALWEATGAHPKGAWWLEPINVINDIDAKSDVITVEAKKLGFWVMGASNSWLKPDAIVLPPWNTHKKYIKTRERENYDGGATSDRFFQVLGHRKWIAKWIKKGVPKYKSVQEAVDYLTSTL